MFMKKVKVLDTSELSIFVILPVTLTVCNPTDEGEFVFKEIPKFELPIEYPTYRLGKMIGKILSSNVNLYSMGIPHE